VASTNVEPLPGKVGVGRRKRVEARKNIGEGRRGFERGEKDKGLGRVMGQRRGVNGLGGEV